MRLLILAPHPDDDILGCTALIRQVQKIGGELRLIIVSDGAAGGDAAVRRAETLAALAVLDVLPAQVEFWDSPDGALPLTTGQLARYRDAVTRWRPSHLALPAPGEAHPDHRRLTRGVLDALTGHWQGELLFYETTTPQPLVNHLLPLDLDEQLTALACHRSQLSQFDYPTLARGFAALRGASIGAPAAEGHLAYPWDGSPQNFFEHRPLVSLILRADDLAFLRTALASLAEQSYDQLEAVVVWHGADDPAAATIDALAPTLALRWLRGPGPRAANLNAGLAAARGVYLGFLDQDDVLDPDHLATLLAELQADPDLDIAYGNCRLTDCNRAADGSTVVRQELDTLGQPWQAGRLLAGNHIPLHAFLCRKRLAQRLRFAEELDAYEDWDFLARAELDGATFRHVDATVCEYRLYPPQPLATGDAATYLAAEHGRKGFTTACQQVEARLLARLDTTAYARLAALIGKLEDQSRRSEQARQHAEHARQQAEAERDRLAEEHAQLRQWADLLAPEADPATPPLSLLAARTLPDGPLLSLLLPVCDPAPEFLDEILHAVFAQSYPHWQLCLADDASTRPAVRERLDRLEQLAAHDPRLRLVRRAERGGIGAATTSAARLSQGDWLLFIDHDDRLAPDALLHVAAASLRYPEATALYSDSRMTDRNGVVLHHYRKSEWAPETLLHLNYINHLSAFRRDLFEAIGGIATDCDGSQDWELWLRASRHPAFRTVHLPHALYDWRAGEGSLAYASSAKPEALDAARRGLQWHLHARLGRSDIDSVAAEGAPGLRHYWPAELQPLTAIIPTHRNPDDLARLIASLAASDYPALQVLLIANRVEDAASLALLDDAARRPGWQVLHDDRPFNWAALNNAAAARATTPWLLFLNDDVAWEGADTLRQLARYLTLDSAIGAVGARLEYGPEQGGGLQHDGIITARDSIASNLGDAHRAGYQLEVPRNVSAVTGACLLTPRAAFTACGGFDERLAVSYNDVDYCLHLRRLGYRIVQASDVVLTHRESRTRGHLDTDGKRQQWQAEARLMRDKWGDFLDERYALRYQHHYIGTRIIHIPEAGA